MSCSSCHPKQVTFASNMVEYEPNDEDTPPVPWYTNITPVAAGFIAAFMIAVLVIWIMGLVRMAHCGGTKSALFWVTLFGFLFVPGIGQLWGFAIGIVALIVLKPGKQGHLMGITCGK